MPIDSRIHLQSLIPDASRGVDALSRGIVAHAEGKRQREQDEITNEQRDRQLDIQEDAEERQRQRDMQIIEESGRKADLTEWGMTLIESKRLFESGFDRLGFKALTDHRARFVEQGKDPEDVDDLINLYGADRKAGLADSNAEIEGLIRTEILKASDTDVLSEKALAQKIKIRAAGKEETSIDLKVDTKGRSKEAEKLAELRVTHFGKLQDTALIAEEQNAGLSQLENIDVETGFGIETRAGLAAVFNSFGVDGDELLGVEAANVQSFNALTGKLVLNVMSTQKGPQTDADQRRIAKTLPLISNEELANEFTMNSLMALNFRRIEMAQFFEDYLTENETLEGAKKSWSQFKMATPLLSDNIKNPDTGLPMFFHEFKAKLLERNPIATESQALNAWRELAQ